MAPRMLDSLRLPVDFDFSEEARRERACHTMQAIHRLPDDVGYRAIAEEIAFLAALEQGDQDIHSGRVVSNEDVRKKLESWTLS